MSNDPLQLLRDAIAGGDAAGLPAAVARLPADALPAARVLAEQIADPAVAERTIRAIDDRADELGVALSA